MSKCNALVCGVRMVIPYSEGISRTVLLVLAVRSWVNIVKCLTTSWSAWRTLAKAYGLPDWVITRSEYSLFYRVLRREFHPPPGLGVEVAMPSDLLGTLGDLTCKRF